jgi:putative membrane protein
MPDQKDPHLADHLANERTFLAWIRTAVGIMAFGFVVVKFSLFVRQLSLVLDRKLPQEEGKGYSSLAGISIVITGALVVLGAYGRFKRIERQIDRQDFRKGSPFVTVLMILVFLMGLGLVAYLYKTI